MSIDVKSLHRMQNEKLNAVHKRMDDISDALMNLRLAKPTPETRAAQMRLEDEQDDLAMEIARILCGGGNLGESVGRPATPTTFE